jgi:hypothetical protein
LADSAQRKADSTQRAKESEQKATTDRWMIWLTGGIVLVAIAQVLLFRKQLGLMHDSMTDTRKAAIAATDGAAAAKEAADATTASVELAKDTAQRQLRAYVGIHIAPPPPQQDFARTQEAVVRPWNHGQTPARNFRFKGWYEVADPLPSGDHPRAISEETRGDTKPGPRSCDPTVAKDINALYDSIRSNATNAAEISHAVLNPTAKRLYLYGTYLYEDAFGDWHHTDFCVQYVPGANPDSTYPWIICTCPQHTTAS